jgi:4'-phosphopantetheinyl transferase EntD
VIAELLPPPVAAVEAFGDLPGAALLPEEELLVARAVPKRRAEFTTVRACARRALAELGLPPVPLLSGPRREPLWPDGVVGSLTHCDGYRAAAVARRTELAALGIDAEPHAALPGGVLPRVALPGELAALRRLPPGTHWDRVLFSAKESVYKAWYPLTGRWLGFEDAVVDFDAAAGTFTARLLVPGPTLAGRELTGFSGRWAVGEGLVVTAIAVPPD